MKLRGEAEASTISDPLSLSLSPLSLSEGQRCTLGVVRVFFHTREWPQPPASPGIRKGPRIVAFERFPAVGVAGLRSVPLARRVIRTFAGMYTYVLTVDLLSSGVQVARHGHHRICSPDRPRVDMWRRTTGGLLEVRRCARGSGAPLPAIWRSIRDRAPI